MDQVVAVIPCRYGSTRFPGKGLQKIKGISVLERTFRRVQLVPSISRIIIATDDKRIQDHAKEFQAEVVMTSSNCATGTDRIAEVVKKDASLKDAAIIVNVQGDEPCIDPKSIEKVITALQKHPEASISTIVTPIRTKEDFINPNIVKCVFSKSGKALYFSRSPIPGAKDSFESVSLKRKPYRHLGIYGFRPHFLLEFSEFLPTPLQEVEDLEMLRAMEHDHSIIVSEVYEASPCVDVPRDIKEVEQWIESQSIYS